MAVSQGSFGAIKMPTTSYSRDRDFTPEYLSTVSRWIEAAGEVLVVMRYLGMAGAKDFAFIRTPDEFQSLVAKLPSGTDTIVFRKPQLPLRGLVDDRLIETARELFPDGVESLLVHRVPETPEDLRLEGSMYGETAELIERLQDLNGQEIALGPVPPFLENDNDDMISASKDGIDGAR